MKKLFIAFIITLLCSLSTSSSCAYSLLYNNSPIIHKSQAIQYYKDRNASNKLIDSVDYIYEYSITVGIDPSIIVAMTTTETGFGKSNLFVKYNNPSGIKSTKTSNGWAHFKTTKEGYRYMIDLLATYAGLKNSHSRLYNISTTTQGLAGTYWTNYGTDKNYHALLTSIIKTMQSYPVTTHDKASINTQNVLDINNDYSAIDYIFNILNDDDNSYGYNAIMKYIK